MATRIPPQQIPEYLWAINNRGELKTPEFRAWEMAEAQKNPPKVPCTCAYIHTLVYCARHAAEAEDPQYFEEERQKKFRAAGSDSAG